MSSFDDAFARLIGNEGGFTKDPNDRGNWTGGAVGAGDLRGTKYGISAMTYPSLDIENLTLDQARAIYLRDFWNKFGGDNLAPELAFQVFDGAVNSGVCRSILWLQEAVGAVADGVFGPATLAAVATRDPLRVIAAFNGYRLKFMKDTKTWPTYSRGWTDRIAENLIAVGGGE